MISNRMASARIAIVDEEFPYPANSGKRLRTLNLMTRLSEEFELTYVAHRNSIPEETGPARAYLEDHGIETVEVDRVLPPKKGVGFYLRLLANLGSPLPYTVSSHASRLMIQNLKRIDQHSDIHLWHCEWTPYVEPFRHWLASPVVVAAHNIESLIWQRYAETEKNPLKRWYIVRQLKKFRQFERWAFGRVSRTITVSPADRDLAIDEFGASNVDVVENGVDCDKYVFRGHRDSGTIIFLGSLDWRPNLDGILQFLNTSFPEIVAAEPEVILQIVGRNPPRWLVDLANRNPNVQLHANVPDVVSFLSRATVMVVPLRIGGGSRLKIIEAAANGLPVVSTRIGAEGLQFRGHGEHYHDVERIEQMTSDVLKVLRDPDKTRQMAERARQLASLEYDWDHLATKQADVWRKAIRAAANPDSIRLLDSAEFETADVEIGNGHS